MRQVCKFRIERLKKLTQNILIGNYHLFVLGVMHHVLDAKSISY